MEIGARTRGLAIWERERALREPRFTTPEPRHFYSTQMKRSEKVNSFKTKEKRNSNRYFLAVFAHFVLSKNVRLRFRCV